MNKRQKELLGEKIMDAGNLAAAALAFGSLVSQVNIWLIVLGLLIFGVFYLIGLWLRRDT
jgi:hypothetical protein